MTKSLTAHDRVSGMNAVYHSHEIDIDDSLPVVQVAIEGFPGYANTGIVKENRSVGTFPQIVE